jgi:hypothetical protein
MFDLSLSLRPEPVAKTRRKRFAGERKERERDKNYLIGMNEKV